MRTRKEQKERAKEILGRQIFGNKWLYALLMVLVAGLILGAVSFTAVGTFILAGIFSIGLSRVFLKLSRKQQEVASFEDLFSGFTDGKAGDNILLGILQTVFVFLWSLLLIIPGIIKSYAYAMAYFVKIDNPEMEANDCITKSRELMKGHKWQLFVMDLSFIGWYIVGILCLGVGTLWVDVYKNAAYAEFYRDLIGENEDKVEEQVEQPVEENVVVAE